MPSPALLPPAPARPAPGTSPLTPAYERLTEVCPGLAVTEITDGGPLPSGPGWTAAAELAAGGPALDRFLAWDEEQVLRDYATRARPDVIASFGLHRYAWPACLLITVPWFLHRRVPRVPAGGVAYHRDSGRMALRAAGFACLRGDPAAAHPDARVVPDEDGLRAEVRAAAAEHLAPLLAGFGPRMRRGRRALWGMATDEIVEGLWYLGHLLGEEPRAVAEIERLLPRNGVTGGASVSARPFPGGTSVSASPFPGGASFRTLTGPRGERLPTRDRASCCLFYTIRPEDTCVTCPRTCDADRVARLSASS